MPVSESKKTLQQYRREHGLCIDGGEEAFGKLRCPFHAAQQAASRKRSQERKKAIGVCQNSGCHNAAMPGRTVCSACSQKASKFATARYYANKAAGTCRDCGKPTENGASRCPDHAKETLTANKKFRDERQAAGNCVVCGDPRGVSGSDIHCNKHRLEHNATGRNNWQKSKTAAFEAYGGAICAGCGEPEAAILEIDHINGGGNQHRKTLNTTNIYLWLKQNDYPSGYRVLCPTCNKKAHAGIPLPSEQKG